MEVTRPLTISDEAVRLFGRISHDRNPLHLDAAYASRTPFGYPVAYGILALMLGIAPILWERPLALRRLKVDFRKPLYAGTEYELRVTQQGPEEYSVRIARGGSEKLAATLETAPHTPDSGLVVSEGRCGTQTARDPERSALKELAVEGRYELASAYLREFGKATSFDPRQMPAEQVAVLCWASYLVGMEIPGRQALFLEASMEFEEPAQPAGWDLDYHSRVIRAARVTGSVTTDSVLTRNGHLLARVQTTALHRPPPVDLAAVDMSEVTVPALDLSGRVALVTGSGRGFGALLALGLARCGASVIVHYKGNGEAAEKVVAAIEGGGGEARLVGGDVREPETWDRIEETIAAGPGRLDLLANNAFPPILPAQFDELSAAEVEQFAGSALRAAALGYSKLLPRLAETHGCAIDVSSEYAVRPPKGFAHYVAAKCAVEGLSRALATEYPDVRFLLVRPPKLLTDQTNVNFDYEPPADGRGVVRRVLEALTAPARRGGVETVDLKASA